MSSATAQAVSAPSREPEEHAALLAPFLDTLRRFGRDRLDAVAADQVGTLAPELLTELADLGVFGVSIPVEDGGFGLGLAGSCAVVELLAEYDRSVATTAGLHLGLGTRPLVAYGGSELRSRLLPDLAAGRRIAAFAATEPEAGSDLTAVQTHAVSTPDGQLKVNGSKVFVTNGGWASVFTLLCATPGLGGARRGQGLVVLERSDPGLVVGPEEHKLGLRASSTTSLQLDDVLVPAERLLGDVAQGHLQAGHVLAWGRTVMAAGCTGTATAALNAAHTHTSMRSQFGKHLVDQPVVRAQLAEMLALRAAMRSVVAHTAAAEDDSTALEQRSLAAKIFCSESDWEICDMALQLHGGSGYIEDTGVPLLTRDARITRIFEGANDVLRVRLGTLELVAAQDGSRGMIADRTTRVRTDLLARYGIRAARRPRELHRLGSLALLREVERALDGRTDPSASLARRLLGRRSSLYLPAPLPDDTVEAVLTPWLEQPSP